MPLAKVIQCFRDRFHDPYLNPEAELTLPDFLAAFPDVPLEELEEALSHWVMHPGLKVLSTKINDVDGHALQVWFVHGLHEEHAELDDSSGHGQVSV